MKKFENSTTVDLARQHMLESVSTHPATEDIALLQALNRVLACDVRSTVDVPRYTNSAMDGFAFRATDLDVNSHLRLPIIGESLAGHPFVGTVGVGQAIRITTGAPIPKELDTVIPYEKTTVEGNFVCFEAHSVLPQANVRRQGEEIQYNQVVLQAGTLVGPAQIALLASVGVGTVRVFSKVSVAVIASGDELVDAGNACSPHQIFNSNTPALCALLDQLHARVENFGIVRDDKKSMQQTLEAALETCDLILISGGAAASSADISHLLINELGDMAPWTINMRPGRPMRFAIVRDKPVFILPGNPVAAYTSCIEFVSGVLRKMQGFNSSFWPKTIPAVLNCDIKKKKGRAEFMRARILGYENGVPIVTPLKNQSSAALTSVTQADCILYLDHNLSELSKGSAVSIHLSCGLLAT